VVFTILFGKTEDEMNIFLEKHKGFKSYVLFVRHVQCMNQFQPCTHIYACLSFYVLEKEFLLVSTWSYTVCLTFLPFLIPLVTFTPCSLVYTFPIFPYSHPTTIAGLNLLIVLFTITSLLPPREANFTSRLNNLELFSFSLQVD
jgi:hypothetical protein